MRFTIKSTEVLKRRNKFSSPCNPDWENEETIIMDGIMASIGCRPPHWKLNSNLPNCSKPEEIEKFRWPRYEDLQIFPPPCNVIENLQYDYEEAEGGENKGNSKMSTPWFAVHVCFPELSYKEIKHVKAYDIESFVGNAGGYIGLFLGYSLMCIPSWIAEMIHKVKETWIEKLNKKRSNKNEPDESSSTSTEILSVYEGCNKENITKDIANLSNAIRIINDRQTKI